jgi:peptidoglycan/xylan/chitin deacetylase (PgdA/CDA1 family)
MAANSIKLLTGNSYPELARLVADRYAMVPTERFSGHLFGLHGYEHRKVSVVSSKMHLQQHTASTNPPILLA